MTVNPYLTDPDWPTNYLASHLTGRYIDLNGDPMVGSIKLDPTVDNISDVVQAVTIVAAKPIFVLLDATGSFDIFIPATDDTDTNPVSWTYTVTELWNSGVGRTFSISAPMNVTQDISAVVPVTTSPGVLTVRGPAGPQGISGTLVLGPSTPVPAGTPAGTIILRTTT